MVYFCIEALLIIAILVISKKSERAKSDYLSNEQMNKLRGISCVIIVGCHYFYEIGADLGIRVNIAYLFVGIFFFTSGYGLLYSLNNKEKYLQSFFVNRILKSLLIPFWVANTICVAISIIVFGKKCFGQM